jgi:tetratricopeptide (TPR) repeat protein
VAAADVAAADVARSLLTGAFQQSADADHEANAREQPVFAATVDQPAAGSPVPRPALSASSNTSGLSDSFTVSSSSIVLPGNSAATGSKSSGKKQTYWQSVANIGRQVADALEYAHKQGVLHRDVKPSNLLLDLRGTVWVTDFGLAKVAGPGGDNLTHTGDILGTLRYMPPEAFEGKSDARGDVYSLGLTLYELLAMKPAFDERDRNKLIKHVTTGEPTPLHKVNRETPRDLVTIIHKAIDRDPSRRYATAEDMASDLQRFLDDEPILARRQTQIERFWRWARHNPGIAVLGGVLTAVLFVATVASIIVASRMSTLASSEAQAAADERTARAEAEEAKNREAKLRGQEEQAKKDAEESKQRAEQALRKAEENFAKARAAVNDYLTAVSEDERLKAPGLQGLRIQLLQSALQFYQQFLKERGNDPTLRRELAGVYLKVGEIYRDLRQSKAASPAFAQALRLYEALAAESPNDPDLQHGLAMALNWTGTQDRAIAILEKLINPEDPKYHADLGNLYNNAAAGARKIVKGKIVSAKPDLAKELEFLRKALTVRERLVRLRPDDAEARLGYSASLNNIAIKLKEDRNAEALALIRRAVEEDEAALRLRPSHLLTAQYLSIGLNNVANWAKKMGETEIVLPSHRRRVEVLDRRARDNPTVPGFDAELMDGYTALLFELRQAGRWEEAAKTVETARLRLAETTEETPAFFQAVLTFRLGVHAVALAWAKAEPDAEVNTEREAAAVVDAMRQYALAGWRSGDNWMRTDPRTEPLRQRDDFKELLVRIQELGQADVKAKLTTATAEEKLAARQKILPTLEALAGPQPHTRLVRRSLAQARQDVARALLEAGQVDEARLAFDEALLARQQLVQEAPSNEQRRADLAESQSAAGDLFAAAGKFADAIKTWDKALATLEEGLKTNPNSIPFQTALSERLLQVGTQAAQLGLWDVSARHYRRAMEIQSPSSAFQWNAIALVATEIQDKALRRAAADIAARGSESTGDDGLWRHRALTMSPETPKAHVAALRRLADEIQNPWHNPKWVRALAYLRLGQADKAAELLAGLTPAEKGWPEWQIQALIKHRLGHAKEAAEALRQADLLAEKRMQGVVADAQLKLPIVWDEWLHNQALRAEAHQAIHHKPAPESPYEKLFRGRVFLALDEPEKAEVEFAAAVALRPNDAEVWLTRSRVFAKLGQKERMAADLLRAQQLKGDDPKTWVETGRMLAERGEHKQADAAFARASALGKGELNRFLDGGWWVVGPYPEQLDLPCPPEKNPDPSKPMAAVGDKRELKWQAVPTTPHTNSIQLPNLLGGGKGSSYALAYAYADGDRTATLHLWPKHDARVWVNGQLVFAGFGEGKKSAIIQIPVTLRKGRNTVLVKNRHDKGATCECAFLDAPVRRGYELRNLALWNETADAFAEADRRAPLREYPCRLWVQALRAAGRDEEARQVFAEMVRRHGQTARTTVADADHLPPNMDEDREQRVAAVRKAAEEKPAETYRYHRLAHAYVRTGQFAEAELNLRKAMANDQLYFHPLLATTLHYLGKTDEAKKTLAAMEQKHADLVKKALAATVYRPALAWEQELWYQATLREARTLILGKDPGPSADETALLAKARARMAELDKAEDDYARLVEIIPSSPRLWIDSGRRLGELHRWDEAAKAFDRAVKLKPKDPKDVEVWKERGRAYADLGKWDEAAADFAKVLELSPAAKTAWLVGSAKVHEEVVRLEEVFPRVAKLRPQDRTLWIERTHYLARTAQWPEAAKAIARVAELDPQDHLTWYFQAQLRVHLGDLEGYRQDCREMLKRFGKTKDLETARRVAIACLLAPQELEELSAAVLPLKGLGKDQSRIGWNVLGLGMVHYREGQGKLAMEAVATVSRTSGFDGIAALACRAMAEQQQNQPSDARRSLEQAREKMARQAKPGPDEVQSNWYHWLLCQIVLREAEALIPTAPVVAEAQGSTAPGSTAHDYAAQRERKARAESLTLHAALAQIRLDAGQKKEAEAELRAVLAEREKIAAEEPANPDYQAELAAAHEQLGQFLVSDARVEEGVKETQLAVALLEQSAAGNPRVARLQVNLAANLFSVGDLHWKAGRLAAGRQAWERALESLKTAQGAAAKDPKVAKMTVDLELVAARAYANLGLWTEASGHFRRAFDVDPVASKVADRFQHAALLVWAGDEAAYRRYCTSVYERGGANLRDWYSAKMMVLRPGALADAKSVVAYVQETRDATKDEWWTVLDVALAQLRADQVDDAFATLQKFEDTSKREWQFSWPTLALARHKAGKIDEAREWLRKTEDWYAGTWTKHLSAGSTELPKDGGLAFWLFFLNTRQEAIATVTGKPAPADAWLHLHRGQIYVKLGLAEKAEAEFQAAVKAQPDDPRIWLARSRIYAALGKRAEAQADHERTIVLSEEKLTQGPGDVAAAEALAGLLLEKVETKWTTLKPLALKSEAGATLTVQPDDSVLAGGANRDSDVYFIETEIQGRIGAIRLEAIPHKQLPQGGSGRANSGNFMLSDVRVTAGTNVVRWSRASADYSQSDFDVADAIDADAASGWAVFPHVAEAHAAIFFPAQPLGGNDKTRLSIRLAFQNPEWAKHNLGCFRLSVAGESALAQHSEWFLAVATPHAKVGATYLALGDAKRGADFLAKVTAGNPKSVPADWLVLTLARAKLNDIDLAKKACAKAAELLKPAGADAALRPLVREVALSLGPSEQAVQDLIGAAAGEPPAKLNEAIEQNPDAAIGYRNRGDWFAARGRWQDAVADFASEFRLQPNPYDGMRLAVLLARTGDKDRYQAHCRAMLERWAATDKHGDAAYTLKAALLARDFQADAKQLAHLAEVSLSIDSKADWYEWRMNAKGWLDYRFGRYDDALAICRASRQRAATAKGHTTALTVMNLAIEAMALHGKGDIEEARRTMALAGSTLEQHVPGLDHASWHDLLAAHILFREAEGLIQSKKSVK